MSGVGNVQFTEGRVNNSDPDILYYNAMIINNTTSTTVAENDPSITYQDTRILPLLKDKSKYQISVENFVINGAGKNLPVLIPQIQPGSSQGGTNTNPNNTVYSISFTWTSAAGKAYQSLRFIQWEPENKAKFTVQPVPVGSYVGPQINSDYYYCYSYTHWLRLMNNALAMAWGDVCYATNDIDGITIGTKCPFFTYDPTGNLFSLWQDANTSLTPYKTIIGNTPADATIAQPPNPYYIFGAPTGDNSYYTGEYSFVGYNSNFEGLLTNFQTTYYADQKVYDASGVYMHSAQGIDGCATVTTQPSNRIFYPENLVIVSPLPNLQDPNGSEQSTPITLKCPFGAATYSGSTPLYYVVTQDFQSTSTLWSPVATINILTSFITVREEYSGTPITIGSGNLGGNAVTGSFQKALMETPIDVNTQEGWRGLLTYEPKLETLSSLGHSKEELKNLNITATWKNRLTNTQNPLLLYNGGSMTMRLKFKKMSE